MKRKYSQISIDEQIPTDILVEICSYCTLKTLLWPISILSKQWIQAATAQEMWKHIQVRRLKPRKLQNLISRYGKHIITINISNMPIPKYIMKTLRTCTNLRKLHLERAWASSVTDDSFCNNIVDMNIQVLSLPKKAKLSEFALKKLAESNIQELSIHNNLFGTTNGYAALGNSTHIQYLNLCGCRQVNNKALREICKLKLISLNISFTSVNRFGIESVPQLRAANTLRSFIFNGIYVPRNILNKIADIHLRTLSLSHIAYEDEDLFILRKFTFVEYLYVSVFEITEQVAKVIQTMQNLKEIYMFCNEISIEAAHELILKYKLLMYKPLGLTHQEKNTLKESGAIFIS